MRPDREFGLLAAAAFLPHTCVNHGEIIDEAVAIAIIFLPGEAGIIYIDSVYDFPHQVTREDVMVAAGAIVSTIPALGVRGLQPLGIDQAFGNEFALGL